MLKWFLVGFGLFFVFRIFCGEGSGSRGGFTIDGLEEFDMMDDD